MLVLRERRQPLLLFLGSVGAKMAGLANLCTETLVQCGITNMIAI